MNFFLVFERKYIMKNLGLGILILIIIISVTSLMERELEGYHGHHGHYGHHGHHGHHGHYGHYGYRGGRWWGGRWGYRWYSPWNWFRGVCKDGCTNIGNRRWGCQYPGSGPNDCWFASDCYGCG